MSSVENPVFSHSVGDVLIDIFFTKTTVWEEKVLGNCRRTFSSNVSQCAERSGSFFCFSSFLMLHRQGQAEEDGRQASGVNLVTALAADESLFSKHTLNT